MLGKAFNFLFILILTGIIVLVGLTLFDGLQETLEENSEAANVTSSLQNSVKPLNLMALVGVVIFLGLTMGVIVSAFGGIAGGGLGSDDYEPSEDEEDEEVDEIFNQKKRYVSKIIPKVLPSSKLTEDDIVRSEFD